MFAFFATNLHSRTTHFVSAQLLRSKYEYMDFIDNNSQVENHAIFPDNAGHHTVVMVRVGPVIMVRFVPMCSIHST